MTPSRWIGQTIGGRYRIESFLGQGNMSEVYKASDPNLRRTVAIKLIHPHLASDPEFIRRFEEEAAAVATLRHPHIIQVYDFNHDGDVYYMVLEYVSGETLQTKLRELHQANSRLPLAKTLSTMYVICNAVGYAHRRGIIHRDLKPANVMISTAGPILMDFGVAKIIGGQQYTATGAVIGTPAYMPPEQWRGEHVGPSADVYSLGVMLFEMIAGRLPFEGEPAALMMMHLSNPAPNIRDFNDAVPNTLMHFIEKALAKNPADRFPNATEMAAAMRAIELRPRSAVGDTKPLQTVAQNPSPKEVKPADLPLEIRRALKRALESPLTDVRLQALDELNRFMRAGDPALALAAREAVERLRDNNSHKVSERAAEILAAYTELKLASDVFTIRRPIYLELIRISAGEFLMGSDPAQDRNAKESEQPQHRVYVSEFYIGKYPVTKAQYGRFPVSAGKDNDPVVGVTWHDAVAFCKWLSKATGQSFRLPTEVEWEKAARGTDGRIYPRGNEQNPKLESSSLSSVGSRSPSGDSPYGVADMSGSVGQWCADWYDKTLYARRSHSVLRDPQVIEEPGVSTRGISIITPVRVVRGGPAGARCAFRFAAIPETREFGFRVAMFPSHP